MAKLNCKISDDLMKRIDRLQELSGAESPGQVFHWAMATYDYLWHNKSDGKDLLLRDRFGNENTIKLRP